MKKKLLFLILCFISTHTLTFAEEKLPLGNNIDEYNKIFQKIAEKRSGITSSLLDSMKNPFIEIEKKDYNLTSYEELVTSTYSLEAIINKKAKINGNWYKQNDMVDSYKLSHIDYNSVILKNENETKELMIRTTIDERKIKISTK